MREWSTLRKLMLMKGATGVPLTEYTATGNPLTFNTNVIKPLKSLIIPWTPVQSGTGAPYPPGGGKNKFDGQYTTGYIATSGEDHIFINVATTTKSAVIPCKPNTTYTVKKYESSNRFQFGETSVYPTQNTPISGYINKDDATQYTYTTGADAQYLIVYVSTSSEQSEPQMQVEEGGSATSYAPYSNIRPISGVSALNVWRTGKNLFDFTQTPTDVDCFKVDGSAIVRKGFVIHLPSGTYTINGSNIQSDSYIYANVVNADGTWVSTLTFIVLTTGTAKTFTLSNGQYIVVFDAVGGSNKFGNANIQLEQGSTATTYSPYTGHTVPVTFPALGKNLLNMTEDNIMYKTGFNGTTKKYTINNSNSITLESNGSDTSFILFKIAEITSDLVGETYVRSGTNVTNSDTLTLCDADGGGRSSKGTSYTIQEGDVGKYITFRVYINTSETVTKSSLQVEQASSASAFEPYTNTAYGGSLNLTTGVLTVEWYGVIANGTEQWGYSLTQSGFNRFAINAGTWWGENAKNSGNVYFSYVKSSSANVEWDGWIGSTGNVLLYGNSELDSAQKWHYYLAEHNLQIVYELATPKTYQLTPAQIQTLIGDNTIWSDTNGSNTAVYLKKG